MRAQSWRGQKPMTVSGARAIKFEPEPGRHSEPVAVDPGPLAAILRSPDGRYIAGGTLHLEGAAAWTAVLRDLDKPGAVASAFFGQGVRDVVLELCDGRHVRGRITGTSFVVGDERVCRIKGAEPLT